MDKNTQISLVKDAIHGCHACSLRTTTPVAFSGSTSPKILVVGQGPGIEELRAGVPWIGKTGRYLKQLLTRMDIPRHNIAWMNVVGCGDNPKQAHIDACRIHTMRQIQVLNSPFILVCGSVALGALLDIPDLRIRDIHGLWWRLNKSWAMAVQHPAAILHNKGSANMEAELLRDLEKLKGAALFGDLMKPKLHEYCIRCGRTGIYFISGIPFCKTHVPPSKRPKAMMEQLSLFG